jgi:cell division protein ZapE
MELDYLRLWLNGHQQKFLFSQKFRINHRKQNYLVLNITLDSQQKLVKEKLDLLANQINAKGHSQGLLQFLKKPKKLTGIYIYGGVGRGKSMLISDFFKSLNTNKKLSIHFNVLMQSIHQNLHKVRLGKKKYSDELIEAVKRTIKDNKILCLDEFQVLDITDAMLLSRIFSYLFSQNILVTFTSNSHPLNLYQNGLQRELFLEFVEQVLLKNCRVLYLDSPTDYRLQYQQNLSKRYFISKLGRCKKALEIIANLRGENKFESSKLLVWGREIVIKKTFTLKRAQNSYEKVAVFNFDELCKESFASADYRAICQNFDLIFLLKLPKLKQEDRDEARRFITFIDEVYENKTALIIGAQVKPEEIYTEGTGAEAFKRTISRLNEIKSDHYWQHSKIKENLMTDNI